MPYRRKKTEAQIKARTMVELHARVLRALCVIIADNRLATVGEVERTINIEMVDRKKVGEILRDFWTAGILEQIDYQYRKNVRSKHYLFAQTEAGLRFAKAQIRWLDSRIADGSLK